MTRQQLLAESVRDTRFLLARYFKGFDDSNYTRQAPGLPNHLAWTLGHLALTMYRTAEKIDGKPVPESDLAKGTGGRDRFNIDFIGFGSSPSDDPSIYPSFARCAAIFDAAIERLASAATNADDATLDSLGKYGKTDIPKWSLMARMVYHNGTHCGQIVDLRRALGMGNILG